MRSFAKLLRVWLLKNPLREHRVKTTQRRLLQEHLLADVAKVVVFLTPGFDSVNGGILSITSLYRESVKLQWVHGAEVVMCTVPGDPLLLKYTRFKTENYIYPFSEILRYLRSVKSLLIQIPEYAVPQFIRNCSRNDNLQLERVENLHINVMIQNIDQAPSAEQMRKLSELGSLTCTTAHEAYSTPDTERRMGCTVHKLSVYVSPEQYDRTAYSEKEDLLIVSRDTHPSTPEVLALLAESFPTLQIRRIWNLTYGEYKNLISKAKWALTFGEGLDGYFLETIFSGGVSFGVFNDRFFTEDFKPLRTVYSSYDALISRIASDLEELNHEASYTKYHDEQFMVCANHYDHKIYVDNLTSFYQAVLA